MRKILSITLAAILSLSVLTGCSAKQEKPQADGFNYQGEITVVSREDGSGTRGAFIELTGVQQKNADGEKEDMTTQEAIIASKTDVMLTNVASDPLAIGYVSMGSLTDAVKAVKVDGVQASTQTVKDGSYKIARPFNIATKGKVNEVTQDFINFILSKQGQEIVSKSYIAVVDGAQEYAASGLSGKVVISGSSSVSPLMEKLKEAYVALNPNVEVEVQTSDSTGGMNDAKAGICDIGMASRELKESELAELTGTAIAMDGIAVIVNTENPVEDLAKEDIMNIYTGNQITWESFEK